MEQNTSPIEQARARATARIAKATAQFNALPARQKNLAVFLIIAISVSLFINFIYKPQEKARARLAKQLSTLRQKSRALATQMPDIKEEQRLLRDAESSFEALRNRVIAMEKQLPSAGSLPFLLGSLVRQADGFAVDFVSIRPVSTTGTRDYESLDIEMKLGTGFASLVNYLRRIEHLSAFLSPKSISLKDFKVGPSDGNALVVLTTLLTTPSPDAELELPDAPVAVSAFDIKRNPFASDNTAQKEKGETLLALSGITFSHERATCIINGMMYRVNDSLGRYTIKKILPSMVVLNDGRRDTVLMLDRSPTQSQQGGPSE